MTYAYLTWSVILLGLWGLVYLARPAVRRKLLIVSAWTSVLGLSEPVFVPQYWQPPTLFDLAERTGFDIESVLFSFAIGGLASTLYDAVTGHATATMAAHERRARRHRWHSWALIAPIPVFIALYALTSFNPIYVACLALLAGGAATWACRPDVWRRMLLGAGLFLALYFVYFASLVMVYPAYVATVWNLPALSGVLIAGIPLEELLFAVTLGWMWSSLHEHWLWRRDRNLHTAHVRDPLRT